MNGVKAILIIGLVGCLAGATLWYGIQALISQSLHQDNGGVIEPGQLILTFIDGSPYANNTHIDWGTLQYGNNTKELNVTNTSNGAIDVMLFVIDLPATWNSTWLGNNTSIAANMSTAFDYVIGVPSNYTDGSYTWNHEVYAEQT